MRTRADPVQRESLVAQMPVALGRCRRFLRRMVFVPPGYFARRFPLDGANDLALGGVIYLPGESGLRAPQACEERLEGRVASLQHG